MQSSALVIEMFSSRIVAFWCVPALHGSGADAPPGQYEPGVHGTHVCCPSCGCCKPAAHLVHAPMLLLGATVPGLHGVCIVLPVVA